jgi:O-antigen/teichoic acid export membrane protein
MGANFVQIATRLITVPIVIKHLGLDGYGIWSIIMVTAAYMRFGSAGIKSAFQKYVAEATGSGDFEKANKLVSTGSALMLALSVVGLTPVVLLSGHLAHAAGVPSHFLPPAAGAISLLALIILVSNAGAGYEAIVTGAQRIDLVRTINIVATIGEAIAIVVLLHFGRGLFAMSVVMAASEISYIFYCMVVSRRILPEIQIAPKYVTQTVLRDFVTFAGSYQLVSIQEVMYGAILPIAVLKFFGATAVGAFAVVGRLVQAALLPQDAFLIPILSGSSLVFASGSTEQMKVLILKAFKTTFGLSILPLAIICASGTTILYAWTGQADPSFHMFLWLMSLAGLFKSISLLQIVLYRASGKSLMDNIRQAIRIAILLVIGLLGKHLGLTGILAGLALTELIGVIFMFFVFTHPFNWFRSRILLPDALKLIAAAMTTALLSLIVVYLPIPWLAGERAVAAVRVCGIAVLTLVAAVPVLLRTGALSRTELHAILDVLPLRRRKAYARG